MPGHSGWLPEADWASSGRTVYHHEVAAKLGNREGRNDRRVYTDYYLVLFRRNAGIRVEAMTECDDHAVYRKQIEALIRSLDLGQSKGPTATPGAGMESRPSQGLAPAAGGAPPAGAGTPPAGPTAPPVPPSPPR